MRTFFEVVCFIFEILFSFRQTDADLFCYVGTVKRSDLSDDLPKYLPIVKGCSQCVKIYESKYISGSFAVSRTWQCQHTSTPFNGKCLPTVEVSFDLSKRTEYRRCTCCQNKCNGHDGSFCSSNDTWVQEIKQTILGAKPPEPQRSVSCFSDKFVTSNFHGIQILGNKSISNFDFEKSSKIIENCSECRKTVFKNNIKGKLKFDEQHWECLTQNRLNTKPCSPHVSTKISRDGYSKWQSVCVCCSDRCNDADFCKLPFKLTSSKISQAKRIRQKSMNRSKKGQGIVVKTEGVDDNDVHGNARGGIGVETHKNLEMTSGASCNMLSPIAFHLIINHIIT